MFLRLGIDSDEYMHIIRESSLIPFMGLLIANGDRVLHFNKAMLSFMYQKLAQLI